MKWFFAAFFLGLDILSKCLATSSIAPLGTGPYPYGGIPIFYKFLGVSFSLNLIGNSGAAWGLFAGNPGALFFLRLMIIGGFAIALYRFDRKALKTIPILLIGAGAVGNALDYLLYGYVIDFLHFNFWGYSFPIFNFADSYICIGAFFLFLSKPLFKPRAQML